MTGSETAIAARTILSEAAGLYACLYPDRAVTLVLVDAPKPYWGQPALLPEDAPELGRLTIPASGVVTSDPLTVRLAVPTPADPADRTRSEPPWTPPRPLAPVFALSPLAYEGIRHRVELRRKRRARRAVLPPVDLPPAEAVSDAPAGADLRPAILVGMHWLEVGGAEKMGFMTVDWALAAGLRVFVVAGTPGAQRMASRLPDHPDVVFLRPDLYLQGDDWPRWLANLISTQNIRLTHNHHCTPLYAALPYLARAVPWVRHIDSTHIVENINGGYPQISAQRAPWLDLHHVISGALVSYLRDDFGVTGRIALGRMLLDGTADPDPLPALTMAAGQTTLHVAFVARLNYQKRPVVAVEILRRLARWAARNGVTLRATMVGEGPFMATITALLARYGLTGIVTQAPADTDVPALLRAADILLVPSSNEGLALVCYEAIEQGCIPLATDVGAQGEILPPALLVPVAPAAAVAAAVRTIDRLWRDPAFLAAGQRGLHDRYAAIKADPTAHDVLMPLYQAAARGGDIFQGQ